MKNFTHKILAIIFLSLFTINYAQNNMNEYCYISLDKDGVKTELKFQIFADSIYNLNSQILSNPNYGEIKKIKSNENGKILEENGIRYLKSQNDSDNSINNKFNIKIYKKKLIILGYKKKKKFLNNKYDYYLEKGLTFQKNKCKKLSD